MSPSWSGVALCALIVLTGGLARGQAEAPEAERAGECPYAKIFEDPWCVLIEVCVHGRDQDDCGPGGPLLPPRAQSVILLA